MVLAGELERFAMVVVAARRVNSGLAGQYTIGLGDKMWLRERQVTFEACTLWKSRRYGSLARVE